MHGNPRHLKYPPWFDTCAFLVVLICSLLGFGGLLSPSKTEAAPTKSNLNFGVTCWHATCAQPADPMIGAQFAATLPQEVGSADATSAVCFGHCVFSSSCASLSISTNANGEGFTFATMMTTSDGGDPMMAVALIPTTPAGSISAAVLTTYYISTMPARDATPAYTSEGASTGRFTGAASMYAEAVPTYRLSPPEYVRTNRLFRLPARATRASPKVIVDIT